jgi:hypothetical protein
MTKILKSLFLSAVVAAVAVGASVAFFSDVEESVGNFFQAGAIDLKVDSEGHYNGLECIDNLWQDCTFEETDVDLVGNGSFETPAVGTSQHWDVFPSGTPGLLWFVEWVGPAVAGRPDPALQELQELTVAPGWVAKEGNQWTELDSDWEGPSGSSFGDNVPALVRIYQNLPTVVGNKYKLSYWYSPRPNRPAGDNQMGVEVNDVQQAVHAPGAGGATTSWTQGTVEFVASTNPTKIAFVGKGTDNTYGMFLDKVELIELEKICVESEEFLESCDSTWDLTDLGPQNQFFAFSDIKPGDSGENTISLHVYDNDAYACMYTRNMEDVEVDPATEPEVESGDGDTVAGDPGEMAENVNFFAWWDDGDNVWEVGELQLTEGIVTAADFLDNVYPLFTPAGDPMQASQTQYLGVAWCAGDMGGVDEHDLSCDGASMGNEAQTDKISADIGFYVEQARHNEGFSCDNVPPETVGDDDTQG